MKKTVFVLRWLLIAISLVWPLLYLASLYIFDCQAEALHPIPFCAVCGLLFVVTTVLTFIAPKRDVDEYNNKDAAVSAVLLIICLLGGLFYIGSRAGMIYAALAIIMSFIMFLRTAQSKTLKVIMIVVSALLSLVFLFSALMNTDSFDDKTITSISSPDASKTAYVMDYGGEFLGGDVSVFVISNDGIKDFAVVRFIKMNTIIHKKRLWSENRMELTENGVVDYPKVEWKDNATLIINGIEYPVN